MSVNLGKNKFSLSMLRNDTFMITCAARTGSTLLVSYLQSHPDILCHGEIYAPKELNGLHGIYRKRQNKDAEYRKNLKQCRNERPNTFLYKIALDRQGQKIVGFKLKHDELVCPYVAQTRHLIQEDTDIKIIHLRRENLLAKYLSWYLVNHVTGVTMKLEGQPLPETKPIKLDPAQCLANFQVSEQRYAFFVKMFAKHPTLEVSYEELTNDSREQKLREIQDFLGVNRHSLTTKMIKLGKKDLSETIENYEELKKYFHNTKYTDFFN